MDLCDSFLDKDGNAKEFSSKQKEKILEDVVYGTFAKKSFRTLLVAYTDLSL